MNSYRTEVNIPVNKDDRTFEEERNAAFNDLEQKYSKSISSSNSRVVNRERSSKMRKFNQETFGGEDSINGANMSDWFINSRKKWDEEVKLMKKSMFSSESGREEFDFKTMDPWINNPSVDNFSRHTTEIQSQSQISGGNQCKWETNQSLFSTSTLPADLSDDTSAKENELKPIYELGQDGQLYFKLQFNSKNYKPEDISVTCKDNTLNIDARKNSIQGNGGNEEVQKSIFIPPCVNSQQFQCHLTEDGVLMLEAPVTPPDYVGIFPTNNQVDAKHSMKIRHTTGPIVLSADNGKIVHLEIKVDKEYVLSDFSVSTDTNRIIVKGRHEVKTSNSSSFKEFSRMYEILERINPSTIVFMLVDGTLVIEASVI